MPSSSPPPSPPTRRSAPLQLRHCHALTSAGFLSVSGRSNVMYPSIKAELYSNRLRTCLMLHHHHVKFQHHHHHHQHHYFYYHHYRYYYYYHLHYLWSTGIWGPTETNMSRNNDRKHTKKHPLMRLA